jgi:hypothetical protein
MRKLDLAQKINRHRCSFWFVRPTAQIARMGGEGKTIKVDLSEVLARASFGLQTNNTIVAG